MRIAIAIARSAGGGAERSTLRLAYQLRHVHGVDIEIHTRGPVSLEPLSDIRVFHSPFGRSNRWIASAAYIATTLPRIAIGRQPDLIHAVQAYSPATIGALVKLVRGTPVIVKITGSSRLGEAAELRRLPFSSARLRLLRQVDRFVVLNRGMAAELEELGIPDDRMILIPNGVELESLDVLRLKGEETRRTLGLEGAPFVAVYLGRLSEEKRIDVLIDAWRDVSARIKGAVLLVVGSGGMVRNVEAELRARAADAMRSGSILFAGETSSPQAYLAACDAFVLPSETEGMSNALLEAMAAARPVVTTRIPANEDLVRNGIHGTTVPVGDVPAMAEALVGLAEKPERREAMGAAARKVIEKGYSIQSVASRYHDLYRSLVR